MIGLRVGQRKGVGRRRGVVRERERWGGHQKSRDTETFPLDPHYNSGFPRALSPPSRGYMRTHACCQMDPLAIFCYNHLNNLNNSNEYAIMYKSDVNILNKIRYSSVHLMLFLQYLKYKRKRKLNAVKQPTLAYLLTKYQNCFPHIGYCKELQNQIKNREEREKINFRRTRHIFYKI